MKRCGNAAVLEAEVSGFIGFYPTADLVRTRAFYEHGLGLRLVRDQERCLIFQVVVGSYLGFCLSDEPMDEHRGLGLILTWLVDDVDRVYEALLKLGCDLEGPPQVSERYRIYHFFARDPNGYRLEMQRFLEPLPV